MTRDELKRLQAHRGFPALSLRIPTHRRLPEALQDPTRFKNLIRRAEQAMRDRRVPPSVVEDFIERVEHLRRSLDYRHLDEGLCVFVGPGLLQAVPIPEPVEEAVVLGDTFLTRDLVRVLNRQPRYRLIVLSEKASRLFNGWGRHLIEEKRGGFPMSNDMPEEPPEGFNRGVDPKKHANERLRFFLKRVRDGLAARQNHDALPLFVVGVDRLRSLFREEHGAERVAGEREGNLDHAGVHEVAEALTPVVEAWQRSRRQQVLDRFLSVKGTRLGLAGLEAVGKSAAEGRVLVLLVETHYAEPGSYDRETGQVTWMADSSDASSAEDIVDEIVETVIERGGEVVFLADGRLSAAEARIGAILRY